MQSSLPLVIGAIVVLPWCMREGLGPEFAGFEIEDLNLKRFVHKHLLGDLNADQAAQRQPARQAAANGTPLTPDGRPPFDPNAT